MSIIFLVVINNICENSNFHVKYVDILRAVSSMMMYIVWPSQCKTTWLIYSRTVSLWSSSPALLNVRSCSCYHQNDLLFFLSQYYINCSTYLCNVRYMHYSALNWNDYIDFMIMKAKCCSFILYRARKFNLNKETNFYNIPGSYVHPLNVQPHYCTLV